MKKSFLLLFITASITALSIPLSAEVKLPAIFSDHAVLQREATVPVWGTAAAGEEVTVGVAGKTQSTKAAADGKWSVRFEKLEAGGPHELSVRGANAITVKDVLIGEVWLGSGQSNMAMTVNRAQDFEAEKAAATTPEIRVFTVKSVAAQEAQTDCEGTWVVCSPDTVGMFSATAFFFGREIHRELKVPVGLINSSVGGTPIESWISPEAQSSAPELKAFFAAQSAAAVVIDMEAAKAKYEKDLAAWKETAKKLKAERKPVGRAPQDPTVLRERKSNYGGLFNGKIAPLIPYAIRGALWYQGEANSGNTKAEFYQYQLPLLIKDWRARWGYDFPFAWVQLPNFTARGDGWCVVREAMLKTLSVPKTGMAVTLDVGMEKNIHPVNKQAVGHRLAQWALGDVYGKKVSTSGPLLAKHEVRGSDVVLSFTHTDGGLKAKGGELKSFVIAGDDKQWHDAKARIEGDSIIVSSADVSKPVAVRYAWKDNPEATLFNGSGLPASQFRTDDWPMNFQAAPEKAARPPKRAVKSAPSDPAK
jgi:sialate O-acetylesterase